MIVGSVGMDVWGDNKENAEQLNFGPLGGIIPQLCGLGQTLAFGNLMMIEIVPIVSFNTLMSAIVKSLKTALAISTIFLFGINLFLLV